MATVSAPKAIGKPRALRARDEGHGRRPARAAPRSWRITRIILHPGEQKVLGAHMLEICPCIADGKPVVAGPSAGHRRQGRPGAAGLRHAGRPGAERVADGSRQPLPSARQRSGRRAARTADAQAAGRAGGVEMPARISRTPARAGFTPAARITPASARRSPRKCSRTLRPWPAWNW